MNDIKTALTEAHADKRFISAQIRLKKNGRFSRINGQVSEIRKSAEGKHYILINNFVGNERDDGSHWQNVLVDNIISVRKDGKTIK